MKNIKRLFSLSFIFILFGLIFATPIAKAEVDKVDVTITATLDGQNKEVTLPPTSSLDYGSNLVIDLSSEDSNHFAFWIVDGVVRSDLDRDTTFTVTNDLYAVAVFTNLKTVTVFMDHNGKMLDSNYDESETSKEPSKVGYDFIGFQEVFNEDNVIIKKAIYELKENSAEIAINITNVANVENIIGAEYNSIVELNEEDQTFTHWEENGKVVSYNANYKFSALVDRELEAKIGGVKESIITLNELVGYRDDYTSYLGQVELHTGDVLVEHGLEVDGVLRKSSSLHPETNEFLISTLSEWSFVRAYAIVKNGETFRTIYDRELPPAITDAQIIYDFTGLEGKGSDINVETLNGLLANDYLKTSLDLDRVYDGGDASHVGMLKLGETSNSGSFKVALKENVLIKTVVVNANGWVAADKLTVNGDEKALTFIENDRLVFVLDEATNLIEIVATNRALVYGLELYGEDHIINETEYAMITYDYAYDGVIDYEMIVMGDSVITHVPSRGGHEFKGWLLNGILYEGQAILTDEVTLVADWKEGGLDISEPFELLSAKDSTQTQGNHTEKFGLDPLVFEVTITGGNLGHYADLRTYANTKIKILVKEGYLIDKIEFDYNARPHVGAIQFNGDISSKETLSSDKTIFEHLENISYFEIINTGKASNSSIRFNSIKLTLKNDVPLTGQEKVDKAYDNLEIGYVGSDNANQVTSNLILTTIGDEGTTITWSSSKPAVVTADGIVNRPDFGDGDVTITLTATITSGTESVTKEFEVTVLAEGVEPDEPEPVTIKIDTNGKSGISASAFGLDKNIFTITSAEGDANNAPGIFTGGLRIYNGSPTGGSITISVNNNYEITKVVFKTTEGKYSPDAKFVYDNGDTTVSNYYNTGATFDIAPTSSLQIQNAGSAQLRITTIEITYIPK